MEVIKALFIPGEEIFWEKEISKGSSNQRNYVITNRRIYKKHYKIKNDDFYGAPEDYLDVIGDILIIERIGIQVIRTAHKLSIFLATDVEDQLYRLYIFDRVPKWEFEVIKRILLDRDSIITEDDIPEGYYDQFKGVSVQDGSLTDGLEEERRKREILERKIKYLNEKVKDLNQNIGFQKQVLKDSSKKLKDVAKKGESSLKTSKTENSHQLELLAQKTKEIEELRYNIEEMTNLSINDIDKKNKEIGYLKQNIAKLIKLHSASKPVSRSSSEMEREKKKMERRKDRLKRAKIYIMENKLRMMEELKTRTQNSPQMIAERLGIDEKAKYYSLKTKLEKREAQINRDRSKLVAQEKIIRQREALLNLKEEKIRLESARLDVQKVIRFDSAIESNSTLNSDYKTSFSAELKEELEQLEALSQNIASPLNNGSEDLKSKLKGLSIELQAHKEDLIKKSGSPKPALKIVPSVTVLSTPGSNDSSERSRPRMVSVTKGRRACPACGNQSKYPILEIDDKDNILNYNPRIYGKKFRCGDCKTEWK